MTEKPDVPHDPIAQAIMRGEQEPAQSEVKPTEEVVSVQENTPSPQFQSFQQRFASFAGPTVNIIVRGLMSVTIGAPFQIIMPAICRVFGEVISATTGVGMLNDVLKLRGDCRDAFCKGLDAVVPQVPPNIPPQDLKSKLMNGGVRR